MSLSDSAVAYAQIPTTNSYKTETSLVHGVKVDYSKDRLFDESGIRRLKDSYMLATEKSPQERFAFVSKTFSSNSDHAQRLYNYASKHWLSYSTPILSFGKAKNSMPISCYKVFMEDTSQGIVETMSEIAWLSMLGGGVGIHVDIRSADEKSTGVMPHLKVFDAETLAYRQSTVRRGSYAPFLNISHPDIKMFIEMRKSTGDPNIRCTNLHHGVNITDDFMRIIERCTQDPTADDSWQLIDPHSKKVTEVISAKYLWEQLLTQRAEKGEPYLIFIDTMNNSLPKWLKDKGLKINGSNICVETAMTTAPDRTAVCCLSSLNLEYYDEWKNDDRFIDDIVEMLDNVLIYFTDKAPNVLWRAKNASKNERDIGIGTLGFHAYLQRKNTPFESVAAMSINKNMFKYIRSKIDQSDARLAKERGEAPDAYGYGKRFSLTMAIAPNASTATILQNTSPSIEPYRANIFRQDTLSGALIVKNRYLDSLIRNKCNEDTNLDYNKIWSSIIASEGSIQDIDIFDDWTKDIYKTAMEISQKWVIQHAADRQQYIDQAQSLNIFLPPDADIKYLHDIHFQAWKKGLKSLYYLRSDKIMRAEKVGKKVEKVKHDADDCVACHG